MSDNTAFPPKPSPRDLAREARRLDRIRQLEPGEPRVIQLHATPIRPTERHFDPAPDPNEAA